MGEKRKLISQDDGTSDGHQETASLFKQPNLLVGKVFKSTVYQRHLNVLNNLMGNNVKVKEIIKKIMLNLDAVEMNIYLGKSLKNNIQKLQMLSKEFTSIFTGLQRKTNMINQSANSVIQPF